MANRIARAARPRSASGAVVLLALAAACAPKHGSLRAALPPAAWSEPTELDGARTCQEAVATALRSFDACCRIDWCEAPEIAEGELAFLDDNGVHERIERTLQSVALASPPDGGCPVVAFLVRVEHRHDLQGMLDQEFEGFVFEARGATPRLVGHAVTDEVPDTVGALLPLLASEALGSRR